MRTRQEIVRAAECARWAQEFVYNDSGPANDVRVNSGMDAATANAYAEGFEDAMRYALASIGANETKGIQWVMAHIFFVEEEEARAAEAETVYEVVPITTFFPRDDEPLRDQPTHQVVDSSKRDMVVKRGSLASCEAWVERQSR